ncbi:TolC family protein [Phenylobacterium sp.]|uniref:TolC family protein n=1 Tax=Phenylobacterium sp. TaxID=1871053 RepID=UPI0035641D5C
MRRTGLSAAILALGLSGCAHYAPAPPHPAQFVAELDARRLEEKPLGAVWTTAELLSEAIGRNPQIAEAHAKYLAALAAARAAKSPPGPSLTLTAEYASEAPRWGYSGAGDIPLDFGTRRSVRVTTAQLQALQAFYDYGETIWSVRTDLERARSDLTAAQQEITLATVAVAVRGRRASRIEDRVKAGQDARPALILARTELSTANGRLAAANGRLKTAVDDLAKALGVSPAVARPLALAPAPWGLTDMKPLPVWRRDAATSRRDVLRAIADYDLAEQALRLEIANQYPSVSLGPAYNYDHGVTKLPFGLSLALPPWDLNRRAIAQAEATRAAAGRSLELAQANALAAVDASTAALSVAQTDFFRNRDRDAPLARGAANLAARSLKAGETDRVDELAAEGAAADAELAANDARHVATGAFVDFEDAIRRSSDAAETAVIEKAMTEAGRAR